MNSCLRLLSFGDVDANETVLVVYHGLLPLVAQLCIKCNGYFTSHKVLSDSSDVISKLMRLLCSKWRPKVAKLLLLSSPNGLDKI